MDADHSPTQHTHLFSDPKDLPLAIVTAVLMIAIGLRIGGDFGVSIDEPRHVRYGQETLQIYAGQGSVDQTSVDPGQHGPFYSLVAYVGGNWVAGLRPGWGLNDGVHFMDYLAFVVATMCLWILGRRFFGQPTAWVLAGAFFTQPVLFGHAFINPKDIPFLAFTLAGLTLGILALPSPASASDAAQPVSWRIEGARRRVLVGGTVLALAMCAALLLWGGWLALAHSVLESAYRGSGPAPITAAFQLLARNAASASLDEYLARLDTWFDVIRLGTAAALLFGVLLAWAVSIDGFAVRAGGQPQRLALAAAAGIAIGLATAIRAIAPIVILPLALLYALELRRSAWVTALILGLGAVVAAVAAWPYLWQSPIRHFLDALAVLSHFPWTGDILFNGQLLDQGQQPWSYVPELIGLQTTLPILALALLGLVSLGRSDAPLRSRLEISAVCTTLALPVLASLRPGAIVYNNYRQFLFTLPALFLLSGLGLQAIFSRLRGRLARAALALLVVLPGVVGLVRLHPFEYIYYNALAGAGATTRFDSDYWCTSYREAMAWVNDNAPPNATVAVGSAGYTEQVSPFARNDLKIVRLGSDGGSSGASLAIVCDGHSDRLRLLPVSPVLMTVSRAGAILAQVKDLGGNR